MGDLETRARQVTDEHQDRIRSVLTLVGQLVELPSGTDLDDSRVRLLDAEKAVGHAAARARADGDEQRLILLGALAEQVRFVGSSLAQHIGVGKAVCDVRQALGRLRSITSTPDLVAKAPTELGRLGYTRVLVSRIQEGTWVTRSAYAQQAPELATELVAAGQARPRLLNASLLETEMVRRRRPMLVTDAQDSPYTHSELVAITMTEAYVAAPVISYGTVIGLLHADKDADAGRVSHLDQEMLGSFAEGFGLALERAVSLRRLDQLRARLATQLSTVTDMIEEFTGADAFTFSDPDRIDLPSSATVPEDRRAGRAWGLTARELDVLREMSSGKSNSQIAAGFFVSETTVKYHVKNVLRKMGASNRADAVARYYQAR